MLFAYVAQGTDVAVIPIGTNSVSTTISLGAGTTITGAAVSADGGTVYMTDFGNGRLIAIDVATNTVSTVYNTLTHPQGIAVYGTTGYVAHNGSEVAVIDLLMGSLITTISVGNNPAGVVVLPNGDYVYVANQTDGTVSVIDTASNTVYMTISLGGPEPSALAVTPAGDAVYATLVNSGDLAVINTNSYAVSTVSISATNHCTNVAIITPGGGNAYVPNTDAVSSNLVSVLDIGLGTVSTTISVGGDPMATSIPSNGAYCYVGNSTGSSVSVIETESNSVIATITLTGNPNAVFGYFIGSDGSPSGVMISDWFGCS